MVVVKPADCFKIWGASASLGRLSTTLETLSRISLAASSRSMSVLNWISILLLPLREVESIFLIPSAPPITSSIFWVISWSIISADADL